MGDESPLDIDALIGPLIAADVIRESDLADLLGLSTRSIRELAERGVIQKVSPGRYGLRAAVQAYCAQLRAVAAARAGSTTLTAERIRATKAQADIGEMKVAATRGELVPAREVEREWAGILRDLRSTMLAVPARCGASLPHLTPHDVAEIAGHIRAALTEMTK